MGWKISEAQNHILRALVSGSTLKVQRDIEGGKVYKLHALTGNAEVVAPAVVDSLCKAGLLASNMKFPAAAFLLTEKGAALALGLVDGASLPLGSRNVTYVVPK